jgi:PAS domain-containing protein
MIQNVLHYRLDIIGFLLLTAFLLSGLRFHLQKRDRTALPRIIWLLVFLAAAAGAWLAENAGRAEQQRTQAILQGFASVYAIETENLGIDKITLTTSPDDPHYLSLIATQIKWLKGNALVSDIYTFKKDPSGATALLVDSETDYDRDGDYSDDREKRTPIGEGYPSTPAIEAAFMGQRVFESVPYTDRWGTWVSALEPLRASDGTVIAVLGVDFAAEVWLWIILQARFGVLAFAAFLVLILQATALAFLTMRADLARRARSAEALQQSEERFRQLSESSPVGVYRADMNVLARAGTTPFCRRTAPSFWPNGAARPGRAEHSRCSTVSETKKTAVSIGSMTMRPFSATAQASPSASSERPTTSRKERGLKSSCCRLRRWIRSARWPEGSRTI